MTFQRTLSSAEIGDRARSLAIVQREINDFDRQEERVKREKAAALKEIDEKRGKLIEKRNTYMDAVNYGYEWCTDQGALFDEAAAPDPAKNGNGNGNGAGMSEDEVKQTMFDATKEAVKEHLEKEQTKATEQHKTAAEYFCLCLHSLQEHAGNAGCTADGCTCEFFTARANQGLPPAPDAIEAELLAEEDTATIPDKLSPRDTALWHALHHKEGAAARWTVFRNAGDHSDARLLDKIAFEFSPRGGLEIAGVKFAFTGGELPKFYFNKTTPKGNPTLQGRSLLEAVRKLMNLPKAKGKK